MVGFILGSLLVGGILVKDGFDKAAAKDRDEKYKQSCADNARNELYWDLKNAKDSGLVYDESEQMIYMNCAINGVSPRKLTEAELKDYDERMQKHYSANSTFRMCNLHPSLNKAGYKLCCLQFESAYYRVDYYRQLYRNAGYYWSQQVEKQYSINRGLCKSLADVINLATGEILKRK